MELVFLLLTILGIIIAIIFGYLQVVVPFIKGEVRFSKRFPFVETAEVHTAKPHRRKKKKRKRFLIPGLAIGILIILFVLVRFLVFQAKAIERVPIAVINFTNRTGDEQFDYLCAAIPNLLITNLEQSKHLSVLTWERMRDLLKVLGKEDVHAVDEDLGFEICKMDDIEAVITGSFTKADNMFVTEVKVLDVASKKILKTSSSQGEGVASILKIQIDDLSQDIAKSVSLYERVATPTEMRIMEVTTTSMEAYNYFLRGREDAEKLYHDDAKKFLEKAIEIDSMFAIAYFYLAWTYEMLQDDKASDKNLERAKVLADKASDKERLYIEAFYEENLEKRFRIFEQLVRKYPKEKWVHVLLGNYYTVKKAFYRAIEECNKALELDPDYGAALYCIAYRYMDMADYAKAHEYFKLYATASPGDANPFDCMGDLFFQMGNLGKALEQYEEALFVKPDFYASSGKIAYIYALREDYAEAMKRVNAYITAAPSAGARARGYLQKACYSYLLGNFNQTLNILDTVEDSLKQTGYQGIMGMVCQIRTLIYYDQGMFDLSRYYLNNCHANLTKNPYNIICLHFYLGLIELKQENLDSAKARLASIKSLLPDILQYSKDQKLFIYIPYENHALFFRDLLYAEVLLAQDSLQKAIAAGKEISEVDVDVNRYDLFYYVVFFKDILARIYLKKGDIDKAILEYEQLTTPDSNKRGRCLIHPTWRYELAKLYEEKGLKTKAIEQYEEFLDIWKNADADRPELIDAKKRLAKLKTIS